MYLCDKGMVTFFFLRTDDFKITQVYMFDL